MKKILLFSTIAVLFLSCEGLEQYPQDAISPETYFRTESDLRLFTNSMYDALPAASDIYSESCDNLITYQVNDNLSGRREIPASGGGWSWGNLRRINFYLQNSYKCNETAIRNRYDGVARFFRAYFYFGMVKRFGDVPWYNEVIESNNTEALQKPRDSRVLVMDSIIMDLNFAIANLPTGRTINEISRWTALALKARVCLFEGSFRKYHTEFALSGADDLIRQAAEAAYEIITNSGYSIYKETETPYLSLFTSLTPVESEYMLARIFSTPLNIRHNVNYHSLVASYGQQGMEKTMVNTYLTNAGTPFTDIPGYETMEYYDEMQNRDPRLSQTIRAPGYTRIGQTEQLATDFVATVTGYQLIKFVTAPTYDPLNACTNPMPIFRYAEVLLNYAEAKAELGTLTQDDINLSINKLRDRVGMPDLNMATANATPDPYIAGHYPAVSGANKGVILEIRRERGVELVRENFRWDDVLRWKAGSFVIRPFKGMYFPGVGAYDLDRNGSIDILIWSGTRPDIDAHIAFELGSGIVLDNGTSGYVSPHPLTNKTWDENKDYLYPIPISERLLNNNLTQNPGWDDGLSF